MKLLLIAILTFGTIYSGNYWGAYCYYKKTAKSGIDYNIRATNDPVTSNQDAKLLARWENRYSLYQASENQWRTMFLINLAICCVTMLYFNERRKYDEQIQKHMND